MRTLQTKESLEGRMLKWVKVLFKYDYDIIYTKGAKNMLPDLPPRAFLVWNMQSPDRAGLYSDETSAAAAKTRLWVHPSQHVQVIFNLHAQ